MYPSGRKEGRKEGARRLDQGSILGFPDMWAKWCQTSLKRNAKDAYPRFPCTNRELVQKAQNRIYEVSRSPSTAKEHGAKNSKHGFSSGPATRGKKNIVEYLGIAADEPKRFSQLNAYKRAPLVEFGIEEDLCGLHCRYEGILAPSYESSCRDGCWMCHNQGINSLRQLRKEYPNLWALLLKWDSDSPVNFHPDGRTVHDFERRFAYEDEGLIIPGEYFRWSMLDDENLNYRWF